MFGDRITTLSSRSYRELAGEPAFFRNYRSAGCKSFLLAGRLQLPEGSLVSDSQARFGSTLFSERLRQSRSQSNIASQSPLSDSTSGFRLRFRLLRLPRSTPGFFRLPVSRAAFHLRPTCVGPQLPAASVNLRPACACHRSRCCFQLPCGLRRPSVSSCCDRPSTGFHRLSISLSCFRQPPARAG